MIKKIDSFLIMAIVISIFIVISIDKLTINKSDYNIELNKDGSVSIHTEYGKDTTLQNVDVLSNFILKDNL